VIRDAREKREKRDEPQRLPATSDERAGVCKKCGGKGWDYVRKTRRSWRIWVTEDCPYCGGTGKTQ